MGHVSGCQSRHSRSNACISPFQTDLSLGAENEVIRLAAMPAEPEVLELYVIAFAPDNSYNSSVAKIS